MKIDNTMPTSSSFEASADDLQEIVSRFMKDENLLKLLKYSVKDALSQPQLPISEKVKIVHNNIRVTPKINHNEFQESILIITFDNFIENNNNPEFRNNAILIDVLCPIETWIMDDYMLRPYKIMHQIDLALNKTKLNGIGRVNFVSANSLILTEDLAGFTMMYAVINDA